MRKNLAIVNLKIDFFKKNIIEYLQLHLFYFNINKFKNNIKITLNLINLFRI